MKKFIFLTLFQAFWAAGYPQSFSIAKYGTSIPAHADLDVHWNAPDNALPRIVWSYHLLPNQFSPEIISNVMNLCSFTKKDKIEQNTNGMVFQSADVSRNLSISFPSGSIQYDVAEPHYGPTNLAEGVPPTSQLPELTTNVLHRLGINFSDITGYNGTSKIELSEPMAEYLVNHTIITNIEYGAVGFRRSIDGATLTGSSAWDGINFGEHGKIIHIRIIWPKLERIRQYPAATPETIVKWMREGKATQQRVHGDQGSIDWATVKSVTVTRAEACYFTGTSSSPLDKLYPHAALWTTVDTGHGNIDVEIDCPIIDETKL